MSAMEVCDDNIGSKRSYKVKEHLLQSLNIAYNDSNSMFILWNKYQIFLYEYHNFESPSKSFVPEFQVRQLIISNNYIICLDCAGNVHTTSLKFKNSTQKRFKTSFLPRTQRVLACVQCSTNSILCLKHEINQYLLCYHQVTSDLVMDKEIILKFNKEHWPLPETKDSSILMYAHTLSQDNVDSIRHLFKVNECIANEYNLVLISFDKMTVYGCLCHSKMNEDEIELVKIYTSASELCDVNIVEKNGLNVLLVLKMGTIIHLDLEDVSKTPEAIHLNTAISKVETSTSAATLLYSDGATMWTARNVLSRENIKFSQLFPKQVKDFTKFGDQIICTTFTNVIYTFALDDEACYVKNMRSEEYCSADTLLNNSEYFYRIIKEIEKGNQIKEKIKEEESYLTALALSRRQDIMEKAIETDISVYDIYTDAMKEHADIVLTEEIKNYFEPDSMYILINVTANIIHQTFNEILSNLFGDIKVHVNLSTEAKTIKTTSIKLTETLKKMKILIPLRLEDNYHVKVDLKLITNIPGSLDRRLDIWTVLYKKEIVLNTEHFMKISESHTNTSFKDPEGGIEDLIQKAACLHHGHLVDVTNISHNKSDKLEWLFYVKLPHNYKEILTDDKLYKKHLNTTRAGYFLKQFGSDEFLKSKTKLNFEIAKEKVRIEIVDDFSSPLLKVTSGHVKIAFNVRNFFSNLVYKELEGSGPGTEYVDYTLYTTTENIKKAMRDSIASQSEEQIMPLVEQFQRNVIGGLPL